ncbi:MAG TPA: NAD(P)-dependent oxidoreductase [Bacteroidales bacterium]|nr:NAD(P)-dependent oxidoreductase [Bacteroidales bacterium]
MMKLLITGGNGFIARNLAGEFQDKYKFHAPARQELDLLGTSKVEDYIKKHRFDVVIHTATYDAAPRHSVKDPLMVLENNLKMFFNVARCSGFFGKMIYFGSGAEFGRENWIPRMKENYFDTFVPSDQYGFSKYLMTKFTLLNNNIYNLRLFGVYGKFDDWKTRLIPNVCCQAVMNMPVRICQNKFVDHLFSGDLVKIVEWFIEHTPLQKVYNVCSGNVADFKTIAGKIVELSGKKLSINFQKEGLGTEYSGDNTLLLKELKSFEFTPIDVGLKMLYEWYVSNKHIYDKDTGFIEQPF